MRAYPVRILHYHEIINDEFGDEPITVTWCPLCGSAVVYGRTVGDQVLTFGVSGKLADDDLEQNKINFLKNVALLGGAVVLLSEGNDEKQ